MSNVQNYSSSQFPLRISEFKAILETRNSEEVVGYTGRSTICPIAKILKKECEGRDTYVHKKITSFKGQNYENPEWVKNFIRQVEDGKVVNDPITVEEALKVVNSIEE